MGFREMRGGDGVSDVEIRRNEIIELLYTYKKYSIDDFAKRFGVSRRTINYDIVYLMDFYEIDTKPGPHGGISLIDRRPNSHTAYLKPIEIEWLRRKYNEAETEEDRIIHNPKEQCNTRSIEVAQLDHEIHTALALPELDADAIIDKILRRAELQFNYCAAGDDDPTTMQIKRACKEFKPTDTFPESFYSSIVSKIILHLDTHIDIKLRNGQTL